MKGYVHIYTGNGKGKTTSAFGIAIRASAYNKKIFIGQFMKGIDYGENFYLKNDPNIEIKQFGWGTCIRKNEVTSVHRKITENGLMDCQNIIQSNKFDIVILDEIIVAIWFQLISETNVLRIIDSKPEKLELILTGRNATEKLIEKADLVTEMKCIKHYYNNGIESREGIEY